MADATDLANKCVMTERLIIEPLRPAHARILFFPLQAAHLYRFVSGQPPTSVTTLTEQYRRWATRPDLALNYLLHHRDLDIPIGTLRAMHMGDGRSLLTCQTFSQFTRCGYSREAASVLTHLLADAGLAVEAMVDTRNRPAQALLAALGFIRIGRIDEADWISGAPSNEYHYTYPRP